MGLVISIEKESGAQIEWIADVHDSLHRLLPQVGANILAGIDFYADTTFNGQQMRQFLPAWKEMMTQGTTTEEKTLLAVILRSAEQCASETHLYLKFVGD